MHAKPVSVRVCTRLCTWQTSSHGVLRGSACPLTDTRPRSRARHPTLLTSSSYPYLMCTESIVVRNVARPVMIPLKIWLACQVLCRDCRAIADTCPACLQVPYTFLELSAAYAHACVHGMHLALVCMGCICLSAAACVSSVCASGVCALEFPCFFSVSPTFYTLTCHSLTYRGACVVQAVGVSPDYIHEWISEKRSGKP